MNQYGISPGWKEKGKKEKWSLCQKESADPNYLAKTANFWF